LPPISPISNIAGVSRALKLPISPQVGEMSGRTEGCAVPPAYLGKRSHIATDLSLTKGVLYERSALAYFEAEIAQPPLAVLTFHRVKPAWQLRSAISSAAFWDGALSFEPQMI
jgi:hypothetical protein